MVEVVADFVEFSFSSSKQRCVRDRIREIIRVRNLAYIHHVTPFRLPRSVDRVLDGICPSFPQRNFPPTTPQGGGHSHDGGGAQRSVPLIRHSSRSLQSSVP